jgi:prefoldin subunit 2
MSAQASSSKAQPKLSPNDVPAMFQRYRAELQNLAQKIGELENELEEHASVLAHPSRLRFHFSGLALR